MDEMTLATKLAGIAADISMTYFSKYPEVWKKSDGTPVTEADRRIEAAIRAEINTHFPQHALLG